MAGARRWIVKLAIVATLLVCLLTTVSLGKYGGGTGEPNDPYQIWDANQMQAIGADAYDWDKHYTLMADIDLSQFDGKDGREPFNVIGGWPIITNPLPPFSGIFDGDNHKIAGFTCNSNHGPGIGLFRCIDDPNAMVVNLGLTDPNIDVLTGTMIGSLVGYLGDGALMNCYASGGSVRGHDDVGGLVGSNFSGAVSNCYYTGSVDGVLRVGGLIGTNTGTISKCYSKSDVLATSYVGGLVGRNDRLVPVAGYVHLSGRIDECYSAGSVEGNESVGGISGYSFEGEISKCYWDTETSSEPNMCGTDETGICDPNYGKTTAEMKQRATFSDWDFVNVWDIGEDQTYPYLRTFSAGDINKDKVVDFRDFAILALRWLEGSTPLQERPKVSIVYPEEGQRLMVGGIPPQTLVSAEASDGDGRVVLVLFFVDGVRIGEDGDGSDGWSCLWEGYSLGWHVLTAKAWDDEGLSGTSEAVNVEVWMMDPPPP